VASVPGETSEARLIVLGASAAGVVGLWGIMCQWSIARRQQTIMFLRALETDRDYIKALKTFNRHADSGEELRNYTHKLRFPEDSPLTKEEKKTKRKAHAKTHRAIYLVLNTDEMIAVGVKNSVLDYRVVCSYRRTTSVKRYHAAENFIRAMRTEAKSPALWLEFQRMAKKMDEDPYHYLL
jgi:hypothetical protein